MEYFIGIALSKIQSCLFVICYRFYWLLCILLYNFCKLTQGLINKKKTVRLTCKYNNNAQYMVHNINIDLYFQNFYK